MAETHLPASLPVFPASTLADRRCTLPDHASSLSGRQAFPLLSLCPSSVTLSTQRNNPGASFNALLSLLTRPLHRILSILRLQLGRRRIRVSDPPTRASSKRRLGILERTDRLSLGHHSAQSHCRIPGTGLCKCACGNGRSRRSQTPVSGKCHRRWPESGSAAAALARCPEEVWLS